MSQYSTVMTLLDDNKRLSQKLEFARQNLAYLTQEWHSTYHAREGNLNFHSCKFPMCKRAVLTLEQTKIVEGVK